MKLFIITVCVIFFNISLFSQQKTVSFNGEYQVSPGFTITITTEGEDHYIQPTGQPKEKLIKINDLLFKIESINGSVDFSLRSAKNLVVVKMYGQTFHAPKLPLPEGKETWQEIKVTVDAMKGLEGEYQLNANAKFIVSIENGSLFVQLTGQQKFEVFPYAINKFFYKVVEASIEFVKNDKGVVEYLLLRQNGMILQADKL